MAVEVVVLEVEADLAPVAHRVRVPALDEARWESQAVCQSLVLLTFHPLAQEEKVHSMKQKDKAEFLPLNNQAAF
jgi:hypothetical protein